jgi:hypothetical protein
MASVGERFVRAIVAKDIDGLHRVLADPVDFQALTPGRHWQAGRPAEVAGEIVLGRWFGTGDDIVELCSMQAGRVADREHLAYRLRVRRAGRDYLVEQQAYYDADGPRISWLRLLCSGYQPVTAEVAPDQD